MITKVNHKTLVNNNIKANHIYKCIYISVIKMTQLYLYF